MKKSELRQLIREELNNNHKKTSLIKEGLIDGIFGWLGNRKRKEIHKKLEKDPEYQKLNQDIIKLEKEVEKIEQLPEYQKLMKDLQDL
jgi:hypothetical protein